jgi:hypothetical protein
MKAFMKSIEINFRYWGDTIVASVFSKEDKSGVVYPIKLNGNYCFTLRYTQDNKWTVVKERNGLNPSVDQELLSRILKTLETELEYAA